MLHQGEACPWSVCHPPLKGRAMGRNQTHRCDILSRILKEGEYFKGRSQMFTGRGESVVPLRCNEEKIRVSMRYCAKYSPKILVKLPWPFGGLGKNPIASPDKKVANAVKSSMGTAILAHREPLKPLWQRRHRCGPQHPKHCRRVGSTYPVSSRNSNWIRRWL